MKFFSRTSPIFSAQGGNSSALLWGGILASFFLTFTGAVSQTYAECGGYVTIGNKAKLKELQAAGYLPVMKNHDKSRNDSVNLDQKDPVGNREIRHSVPLPCSGPQCQSGKSERPAAPPIAVGVVCSIKSLVHSQNQLEADIPHSFLGFRTYSETPICTKCSLDRPPE